MSDPELEPMLSLHRLLDRQHTLETELDRVAHLARDMVTGVHHVGLTLLDGDRPSTAAATDSETLALVGSTESHQFH